jgi:hypothetical protein
MSDLKEAIEAIKSGDKATGRTLLTRFIKSQPRNEVAWLWLAAAVNDPNQKKHCLQQALQINPDNSVAKQALHQLEADETVEEMPGLSDLLPEPQTTLTKPTPDDINPNYIPREVLHNLKVDPAPVLPETNNQTNQRRRPLSGSNSNYSPLPPGIRMLMLVGFTFVFHFSCRFLVGLPLPNLPILAIDYVLLGVGLVCLVIAFSYMMIRDSKKK